MDSSLLGIGLDLYNKLPVAVAVFVFDSEPLSDFPLKIIFTNSIFNKLFGINSDFEDSFSLEDFFEQDELKKIVSKFDVQSINTPISLFDRSLRNFKVNFSIDNEFVISTWSLSNSEEIIFNNVFSEFSRQSINEIDGFSLWVIDLNFKLIKFNSAFSDGFEHLFDFRPELGTKLNDISKFKINTEKILVWLERYKLAFKGEIHEYEDEQFILGFKSYSLSRIVPLYNPANTSIIGAYVISQDISKQTEINLALKESEEKYKTLVEQIPIGIYRTSSKGEILHANQALCDMLKIENINHIRKYTVFDFYVDFQDRKEFLRGVQDSSSITKEYRMKTSLNEIIWVRDRATPIFDNNGRLLYFNGLIEDITEAKTSLEMLEEREALLSDIVDSSDNIIFVVNFNKIILYLNTPSKFNLDNKSFYGEDISILCNQLNFSDLLNEIEYVIQSGSNYSSETEIFVNNEMYYYLNFIYPISYLNTSVSEIACISTNITNLKKAEIAIQDSKNELELIINSIPALIYYKDINNRFVKTNKYFSDFIIQSQSLKYKSPELFDEVQSKFFEADLQVLKDQNPITNCIVELNHVSNQWFKLDKLPFFDSFGNMKGLIGFATDISELKQVEAKLKEINASKDRFFSLIAHDLKNPISGFTNLLNDLVNNFKNLTIREFQEVAISMQKSADNLFKLLNNLLEWASAQTGKISINPVKINVKHAVNEQIEFLNDLLSKKHISVINNLDESFYLNIDYPMFSTIVRNLISNACKYSYDNSNIEINAFIENNFLIISIKDFGIGISDEFKLNIFKADVSIKNIGTHGELGTGLGLILSKEFTELNNGIIWFESDLNQGTIFFLKFPYNSELK